MASGVLLDKGKSSSFTDWLKKKAFVILALGIGNGIIYVIGRGNKKQRIEFLEEVKSKGIETKAILTGERDTTAVEYQGKTYL